MATTTRDMMPAGASTTMTPRPQTRMATLPRVTTVPWPRLALGAVLALAAALNFWALDRLGYANDYYAAAVRSMLLSWHNFFFMSFDPGGFVTIDKPPLGFWLQAASAKLFGYSGVSLLLPEVLAGVLAVAVLYRLVARAWARRGWLLPVALLAATGAQAYILCDYPAWSRWLTPTVVGAGLVAAAALVAARLQPRRLARAALVAGGVAVAALLVAPTTWAAYSVANNTSTGNIPTAGPSAQSGDTARGFGGPIDGFAPGGTSGAPGASTGAGSTGGTGSATTARPSGAPGGVDGFGDRGSVADAALVTYLEAHQGSATYLVATSSSQGGASSIIIQTGKAVMALGGFAGSDQILSTQQLARLVANGTVHYFLIGSGGPGGGGGNSALTQWITTHGTAVPASAYETSSAAATGGGGQTLYYVSSAAAK